MIRDTSGAQTDSLWTQVHIALLGVVGYVRTVPVARVYEHKSVSPS
jgi:hypothetical protein